jgi:hypothetical protein
VTDESLRHLLDQLAVVEERVRTLVAARRAVDPAPDDPLRGLYLSDAAITSVLDNAAARLPPRAFDDQPMEADLRLPRLANAFGLTGLDVELLLIAMAPDLDARFEQLYGYLNDDVSHRRATPRLAFDLLGMPATDAAVRSRLDARSPLVDGGLIEIAEPARPFLTRVLRVPDVVTAHLLGGSATDPVLVDIALEPPPPVPGDAAALARAVRPGRPAYLRGGAGSAARGIGVALLTELGLGVLALDLARVPADADAQRFVRAAAREARLHSKGILAGPVDASRGDGLPLVRALATANVPVVLVGTATWDPHWAPVVPVLGDAPDLNGAEREAQWRAALPATDGLDPVRETAAFRLGPEQILRAAEAASVYAAIDGGVVTAQLLRTGARSQNSAGLERLARRIVPAVGWDGLVLPDDAIERLRELVIRARHRDQVLRGWNMRPGGGRGVGVTALFTGESGTGKTISAEVVARDLGVDLYVVDLATVVDKYVGETEKNLERIFTEAAGVNGVLLFDEADAIFGKRSDVQDAHDRYANVEVAYLLQRMESFDGLAILTTNLRANIDEAFTRRLDMVVDFPQPDEPQRLVLWDRCLGTEVPRANDLDLASLARTFELSGGDIRSATVTAAYFAAANARAVEMADLVRAVDLEYTKLGRLRPIA